MPAIFVSYRRHDSAGHAGRLFDRLKKHFGYQRVFWDVSGSIEPGEPFDKAIERAIESSDVVLAVIGNQWLNSTDEAGKRRIEDPSDYVRLELAMALRRKDVRVIPVLVQRAVMPRAENLPQDLQPLALHHAIELTDGRWDFDVSQLIDTLEKVLGRPRARRVPEWTKPAAASILLIAGGFGIWALWPLWPNGDTSKPEPNPVSQVRPKSDTSKPETIPVPEVRPKGDTSEPELISVPDVQRLSLDAARSRLAEARLRVGRIAFYTLGRYEPGIIYNQKTAPGTRVRPDAAIGLYIERERLPGIQSSGQMYLSPTEVWDLDGERNSGRQDVDIRFDAASATERYLEPQNGAVIGAVGRTSVNRDGCADASLSNSRILLEIGAYLCVRTNRGRYSLLRIDDLSRELKLSFDTWQSNSSSSGSAQGSEIRQVQLGNGDAYHFLKGIRSKYQGGDFYVHIAENGAVQFVANNRDQRGLVDLGDISKVPLSEVPVPKSGYYKFGVPVVAGHTYVSLARTGEEEHFVVLRVDRVTSDSVMLSYVYR